MKPFRPPDTLRYQKEHSLPGLSPPVLVFADATSLSKPLVLLLALKTLSTRQYQLANRLVQTVNLTKNSNRFLATFSASLYFNLSAQDSHSPRLSCFRDSFQVGIVLPQASWEHTDHLTSTSPGLSRSDRH